MDICIERVWSIYFSPTQTTKTVANTIAQEIASLLNIEHKEFSFTTPKQREKTPELTSRDLVIFASPVYIGRVPNLMKDYMLTIRGNSALAVAVCVYGNRAYDNALIELRDILQEDGFNTIAAGAFVGEHSFSTVLAKNRPDKDDLIKAKEFAGMIIQKTEDLKKEDSIPLLYVKGEPFPYNGFFNATNKAKKPIDIRKVKPKTNSLCNNCKLCVELCSMGSISKDDPKTVEGICIKCGACIKGCPQKAKFIDDEVYLFHLHDLEEKLQNTRGEIELFL